MMSSLQSRESISPQNSESGSGQMSPNEKASKLPSSGACAKDMSKINPALTTYDQLGEERLIRSMPSLHPHNQQEQEQQQQQKQTIPKQQQQQNLKYRLESGTMLEPRSGSAAHRSSMNGDESESELESEFDLKRLLIVQKQLADQYRNQMDKLTEQLRYKLRQLTDENRQLREDNERLEVGRQKLLKDLQEKIVEANEAREMEAIYSSRLTKVNRKCKKMQHAEEESYLEFIF